MMKPLSFQHEERRLRVRLGDDALDGLLDELEMLGCSRAWVVMTPGRAAYGEQVQEILSERCVGVFTGAVQHVPRSAIVAAQRALEACGADCCIAVGGGSPIGLAKALALESSVPLPIIAIPTTYSGSEATTIWGLTEGGRKITGRDPRVAPTVILYIPSWTVGLPAGLSAASGVNAMAHCVEALYAADANPMTQLMAAEGVRALSQALPGIQRSPSDLGARGRALWGAFLAGRALDGASMGVHHKLCHVLGGSCGLPHARTHAVVLPYAIAYNAPATPEAMTTLRTALGDAQQPAATQLYRLNQALAVPSSLSALGLKRPDLVPIV
ncbi:MAG: maleylacetate reductase, partial [Myxococcota bacterium]